MLSTQTQPTMLSTEIVALINDMREEGAAILRHSDFMAKIVKVLGEEGVRKFSHSYINSQNKEQPCYALPKRETELMVMSESYKVQAAVYDKMTNLETALSAPTGVSLSEALAGMEIIARMLNMSPSSALGLTHGVVKIKAPELSNLLPSYSIDAPRSHETAAGSSLVTFSATELLRQNGSPMTAAKFNKLAIEHGYLCEVTRPSRANGTKKFKAITEKGLKFGKNITHPTAPNETQPHYYQSTFALLLGALHD